MVLNNQIVEQLQNKTVVEAHNFLLNQGVKAADVGYYLGEYLRDKTGKGKRTFNYSTNFLAQNAACITNFEPQFVHQDWVDGEDVVQAGETPNEEGFNRRFHSIEDDFAAIKQDLARSFQCMAEMRASLRALLDEVRLELNRLNNDIAELSDKEPGSTFPTFPIRPDILTDPNRKFLGVSQFAAKDYLVYEIGDKFEMLPLVSNIVLPPSNILDDPRIANPGIMGKFFEEIPEIRGLFEEQGEVSPLDITERFGDMVLDSGSTVRDAMRILPADETFSSPELMIERITDLNAAVIRATEGTAAIRSSLGVESSDLGTVVLERISTDAELTDSLFSIGIKTVEDIQKTDISTITERLASTNTNFSSGELAKIVTTSTMFRKLR